jgi:TorA maturation chaperone TorD
LLVARLLSPPRPKGFEAIAPDDLDQLAFHSGLKTPLEAGRVLRVALELAAETEPSTWSDERTRLFEGGSICPPNETAYVRRDKGAILADLCGFYGAFGFELAPESGEKADHIVTELEFLSMLLVMLARSDEAKHPDAETVTRDALAAFARDHLGEWVSKFCDRLAETTSLPLFRNVARLLDHLFETVAVRHGLPRSVRTSVGSPEVERGTPYECGMTEPRAH